MFVCRVLKLAYFVPSVGIVTFAYTRMQHGKVGWVGKPSRSISAERYALAIDWVAGVLVQYLGRLVFMRRMLLLLLLLRGIKQTC